MLQKKLFQVIFNPNQEEVRILNYSDGEKIGNVIENDEGNLKLNILAIDYCDAVMVARFYFRKYLKLKAEEDDRTYEEYFFDQNGYYEDSLYDNNYDDEDLPFH